MGSFLFWQRWLVGLGIAVSVFGLCMVFFNGTFLFEYFNREINPAFWGTNTVDDATKLFQEWVYGVWGATIAGWGTVLIYIACYPFKRKERWSWNCLALALLVWFVLDTSLSIFYTVHFNAILNLILMVLAGLPIMLTRREFV